MVAVIVILSVALIVAIGVIALLFAEISRITRGLQAAGDSNALITSFTGWRAIRRLTAAANLFVHRVQSSEHRRRQQEVQVRHMLTNLTHDIKTPLTVASGYVQMVQTTAADPRLAKVLRNLGAVNDYLRYLMNYTLLQEKSVHLELAMVDLTKLLTDALISNYEALAAKKLRVQPALAPHVRIVTDRTVMNRIVQNMIGNWLKYADGDVAVALTSDDRQVTMRFANHSAQPLADLAGVQARFATGDAARSDNSVGLGLNIVHDLLVALGGTLTLSGEAQRFVAVITLPVHQA